jgi:hypothetical protein
VCLNGHPTTSDCELSPELRSKFCAKCGATTISACPECNANIRGHYYVPGVISVGGKYQPPNFCHNCGKSLPWTSRSIEAAKELTDEIDTLTAEEKGALKATFEDLTADSPKTQVATVRYKKFLAKVGPVLGDTLNKIVVPVATEAVKKMLGL